MLSTGIPSTLENWLGLCHATFGKDAVPTKFIEKKIEESPNGKDEEVVADEQQLLHALGQMFVHEMEGKDKS
jgi:hypothetical protein